MLQVVWVTGASSGIGAAFAAAAPPGARVIGIARRRSVGEHLRLDLSRPEAWAHLERHVRDVLANADAERAVLLHAAATGHPPGALVDVDAGTYEAAVLLHASALVLGRAFLAACEVAGIPGTLVLFTSPAAGLVLENHAHYAAGKAAVEAWVKAAAVEQSRRPHPAQVFAVRPWAVDTPMLREALTAPPHLLPMAEELRAAVARTGLASPKVVAEEIWRAIEAGVELGAIVDVGAVPADPGTRQVTHRPDGRSQ